MKKLLMVLFLMSSVSTAVYADGATDKETPTGCGDNIEATRCKDCTKKDPVGGDADKKKVNPTAIKK